MSFNTLSLLNIVKKQINNTNKNILTSKQKTNLYNLLNSSKKHITKIDCQNCIKFTRCKKK